MVVLTFDFLQCNGPFCSHYHLMASNFILICHQLFFLTVLEIQKFLNTSFAFQLFQEMRLRKGYSLLACIMHAHLLIQGNLSCSQMAF